MNNNALEDGIYLFILISIALLEAIQTLLSIPKKGFLINPKTALLKKSNKELKAMLVGVKRLSSKNKKQLVELVLLHS